MKKFKAEIDGKAVELEFRHPPNSFKRTWLEFIVDITEENKLDDTADLSKLPPKKGLEVFMRIGKKKNEMLMDLCTTKENIEKADDFDNVSSEDLRKIHNWLFMCLGITVDKKEEGFTAPSPSAQS